MKEQILQAVKSILFVFMIITITTNSLLSQTGGINQNQQGLTSNENYVERESRIDAFFKAFNNSSTPGAAILVSRNGKIVFEKGYGLANIETKTPVTGKTAFDLASLSKQFTAVGILLLAEQKKLSLDDTVSKFFPQFPNEPFPFSIRQLLNHTSGIQDYIELFVKSGKISLEDGNSSYEPTSQDVLKLLAANKDLKFRSGEKWEYSNSGYVLLALIIEKVSGKSYPNFIRDNIFRPLKMKNSIVYSEKKPKINQRAHSYQRENGSYKNIDYTPLNLIYGDGSINSTAEDLVKWENALSSGKFIKHSTLQQAFSSGQLANGKPTNYGFGWFIEKYQGLEKYWHSGGWVGFRNYIVRFPEKQLAVIILSNSAEFNPVAAGNKIADIFLHEN